MDSPHDSTSNGEDSLTESKQGWDWKAECEQARDGEFYVTGRDEDDAYKLWLLTLYYGVVGLKPYIINKLSIRFK